ncbi:4-hydroxybenzoate polyprenyl transferase, partial [Aureobasidium melanogenum]
MLSSRLSASVGRSCLINPLRNPASTSTFNTCRQPFISSRRPNSLNYNTRYVTAYSNIASTTTPLPPKSTDHSASVLQHEAGVAQDAPPIRYEPPKSGLLSYLPASFVPYAELIRIDKPYTSRCPVGCTINDLWDRNLDPKVSRTRLRPIARGAISPEAAIVYTGCQLLTGLAVLLQFPFECFFYATPSLLLVSTYPLAKRVTNYPQAVLGLTFSWGAIMGFPALGVDLLSNHAALTAAACLYSSNIAWTILYDMIYAHQDIKDDAKAGIKSIALRHEKNTKAVLSGLAVVHTTLLAAAGAAIGAGPIFYIGTCGGALFTTANMIWRVRLSSVKNCWWWFRNGCWMTGGAITLGLTGEYLAHYLGCTCIRALITSKPGHPTFAALRCVLSPSLFTAPNPSISLRIDN